MKDMIKGFRAQGKTIVLTTHNMQDVTELCDRVAFLPNGQIKALDTPHRLRMAQGATELTYAWREGDREQRRTVALTARERTKP